MLDVRGGAGARHEDAVRAEVEGLLDADAVVGAADANHLRRARVSYRERNPDRVRNTKIEKNIYFF